MDEEKYIEKLTERVRAEQATAAELKRQNDLAARTLRQAETSERIRQSFWADISEKTAGLVGKLPELEYLLHSLVEKLDEFGGQLGQVEKRLDRIEYALMLILGGKGNGNRAKTKALVEDIDRDRTRRKLLDRHYRILNELQVQLADYGPLARPVHLVLQVEDLEKEIDKLEQEMEEDEL